MKRNVSDCKGSALAGILIGVGIAATVLLALFTAASVFQKYYNNSNAYNSCQQTARTITDHLTRNLQSADVSSYVITYPTATEQSLEYTVSGTKYYYIYYYSTDSTYPGQLWWGKAGEMAPLNAAVSSQNNIQLTSGSADPGHNYQGGIFCIPAITNTNMEMVLINFTVSVVSVLQGTARPQQIEVFTAVVSSNY